MWILLSDAVPTLPPKAGDLCHPLPHVSTLSLPLFYYRHLLSLRLFVEVLCTDFVSTRVQALCFTEEGPKWGWQRPGEAALGHREEGHRCCCHVDHSGESSHYPSSFASSDCFLCLLIGWTGCKLVGAGLVGCLACWGGGGAGNSAAECVTE